MAQDIKVLALLGSPRRNGNTETLLDIALDAARETGAQAEKIWLRKLQITPCIGCFACSKTGQCVLSDDMSNLYPKMEQADRLIMASPVYFYSVTAWAKAAIDRFQPFWARKYVLKRPEESGRQRWGSLIAVGATKGKRLFEGSVLTAKYCLSDAGFKYCGHLLAGGLEHIGDAGTHPELISAASELGKVLVAKPEAGFEYRFASQ